MSAPIAQPQFFYAVFCAWCHDVISYRTVEHSSGICLVCADAMRAHARAIGILRNRENNSPETIGQYAVKKAS